MSGKAYVAETGSVWELHDTIFVLLDGHDDSIGLNYRRAFNLTIDTLIPFGPNSFLSLHSKRIV